MARLRALGRRYEPMAGLFNEYNGYIALTAVVLGTGFAFEPTGEAEVKGFDEPVAVREVRADKIPAGGFD